MLKSKSTGLTTYQVTEVFTLQNWSPPQRPAVYAEQTLIAAIIHQEFPPGCQLPAERELAARLGITRPTLREALQRLERDGWLTIQQGKPTRVNDYWQDGGLNVLSALVHHRELLPEDFIPNLLGVRIALAPVYTRLAVEKKPAEVSTCLQTIPEPGASPVVFAAFDWQLHHTLTIASMNPIYTLILNGFAGFYEIMAQEYFIPAQARLFSHQFYLALRTIAQQNDGPKAETLAREVMVRSAKLWQERRL
ncbi:MAG: fatty acid metabolism transcriptional regulator FadR, partial [Anaerolineales bacterium]|nr:fatty acid metabolism transcriptional regulator FadR [Anaerolineales bacterium]